MGGKSVKRQWSAEDVERRLNEATRKKEESKAKSLVDMFDDEKEV
jgi:hypothetical protein